jgi:hypothetical protein
MDLRTGTLKTVGRRGPRSFALPAHWPSNLLLTDFSKHLKTC